MTKRLSDTREMSREKADQLLQEISDLEIQAVKKAASSDARINKIKAEAKQEQELISAGITVRAEQLKTYILAHPDEFKKPRSRQTPFGRYGMRETSGLEIDNEAEVLEFLKENRMNTMFKIEETVLKTPLRAAVKKGIKIPGVRIDIGETTFYQVDKVLLAQAKKETIS